MKDFSAGLGQAEDTDLLYERRLRIVCLEFFGINILAVSEHNNVFASAGDRQQAIRIDETEISRSQPAIPKGLRGLTWRVVIALHQNRSVNANLANPVSIR